MRICFICTEIFAWNKFGGFGKATRLLGRELAKHNIEVFAVVPKRKDQKAFEILDGIKVLGFPPFNPLLAFKLFRSCDADVYHSEEPSVSTFIAMKAMPHKVHLITARDPKLVKDWISEFTHPSYSKLQVAANYFFEDSFIVKRSVRKAAGVYCAAKFLSEIVQRKYSLTAKPPFLPTPVEIPSDGIEKTASPSVCFLGRWDKRKRPELFFRLAEAFPGVNFISIGRGRNKEYDNYLRRKYSHLKNLRMTGFINQFETNEVSNILGSSWILVNTALREGLPNSFLEAMAHKCAILSSLNPENVAECFGYHVKDNNFERGLSKLLENNNWKTKGELGQAYVIENYGFRSSVSQHISIYQNLTNNKLL